MGKTAFAQWLLSTKWRIGCFPNILFMFLSGSDKAVPTLTEPRGRGMRQQFPSMGKENQSILVVCMSMCVVCVCVCVFDIVLIIQVPSWK